MQNACWANNSHYAHYARKLNQRALKLSVRPKIYKIYHEKNNTQNTSCFEFVLVVLLEFQLHWQEILRNKHKLKRFYTQK